MQKLRAFLAVLVASLALPSAALAAAEKKVGGNEKVTQAMFVLIFVLIVILAIAVALEQRKNH